MTPATLEAAIKAPMHPALRWTPVFDATDTQHRRTRDGGTVCGIAGPLTLAETTHPRCTRCFGD